MFSEGCGRQNVRASVCANCGGKDVCWWLRCSFAWASAQTDIYITRRGCGSFRATGASGSEIGG